MRFRLIDDHEADERVAQAYWQVKARLLEIPGSGRPWSGGPGTGSNAPRPAGYATTRRSPSGSVISSLR